MQLWLQHDPISGGIFCPTLHSQSIVSCVLVAQTIPAAQKSPPIAHCPPSKLCSQCRKNGFQETDVLDNKELIWPVHECPARYDTRDPTYKGQVKAKVAKRQVAMQAIQQQLTT